jgi:hypothetical protein
MRIDCVHVLPRSRLAVYDTPAPSFQIACAVPSGVTSIHGRSSKRTFESVVQRQVAPASLLTPTAICRPSPAARSKVIDAK